MCTTCKIGKVGVMFSLNILVNVYQKKIIVQGENTRGLCSEEKGLGWLGCREHDKVKEGERDFGWAYGVL